MIRILIATGIYPPEGGGPATYSKLLKEKLPNYGFKVEVVNFGDFKKLPKIVRHFFYFLTIFKKGLRSEIIYAQDPVSVGLPAMLVSKILRKKFILKIVGDYVWEQGSQRFGVTDLLDEFSQKNDYGFKVGFLKFIQTMVAKNAHKIIVPSQYLKKIISYWVIDRKKIFVIYNAFNIPTVIENKDTLKSNFNLSKQCLLSVSRLVPWKGFIQLIKAFSKITNKFPNLQLVIIGDGPQRKKIEQLIIDLDLAKKVLLIKQVNHNILLKYLKAADIFILNTSYEGFSHLILETMAMGTPIVTTSVGGNTEILKNEENSLLIQHDNQKEIQKVIEELLTNENLVNKLIKNAQEKIKEFSEERMLKELTRELKK